MAVCIEWMRRHRGPALALVVVYWLASVFLHQPVLDGLNRLAEALGPASYHMLVLVGSVLGLALATRLLLARDAAAPLQRVVDFYWVMTLAVLVLAWVFLFAVPSEAAHLPQYAMLAIPLFALTRRVTDTIAWATLLGAFDEAYQYFVLTRDWQIYYDFNDVVLNLIGAALGVLVVLTLLGRSAASVAHRPRPYWRSPPLVIAAAGVGAGFVLYFMGRLHLYPTLEPPGAWILLSRAQPEHVFWTDVDWGKNFHILQPLPALIVLGLLTLFYGRLDVWTERSRRATGPMRGAPSLDGLSARLRRVTCSTEYLPAIDGLRFFAILAVVLYHVESFMPDDLEGGSGIRTLLGLGNIGVQFFFAISGFILAVPFLSHPVDTRRYYLRRLVRLEPPYLISLVLVLVLGVMRPMVDPTWKHFLASAFYVHGYVYGDFSTINFVAWSLEVEVQFYLLMPLLAWLFFRSDRPWLRRGALVAACLPFVALQAVVHDHFPHGLFLTDQIQFFVAGIILADVYVTDWSGRLPGPGRYRFDLLALAAFAAVPAVIHGWWEAARLVTPVAIGVGYWAALRGRVHPALLANRWIAVLGGMCYTVYLYHWQILYLLTQGPFGFPFRRTWTNVVLLVPGLAATVFILSAPLFLAFEKPFMKLQLLPAKHGSDGGRT